MILTPQVVTSTSKSEVFGLPVQQAIAEAWRANPELDQDSLEADGYIVERLFFDFSFPGIVMRDTAGRTSILSVYIIHYKQVILCSNQEPANRREFPLEA